LFPFVFLRKLFGWASLTILILAVMYAGSLFYDYKLNAYRYAQTATCNFKEVIFPSVEFDFIYNCIDVRNVKNSGYVNALIFMANEDRPTIDRTGHGWLAFVRLSDDPGELKIFQLRVFGFWGDPSVITCSNATVRFYQAIEGWLPDAAASLIKANYSAFCMKGVSGPEGPNLSYPLGEPFAPITELSKVHEFVGRRPAKMLVVLIDEIQYNNSKFSISQFSTGDYTLIMSDCTTLLYEVAESIGLYTPPRWLYPFPSNSVEALSKLNTKSQLNAT
jgi:hypothetical protein